MVMRKMSNAGAFSLVLPEVSLGYSAYHFNCENQSMRTHRNECRALKNVGGAALRCMRAWACASRPSHARQAGRASGLLAVAIHQALHIWARSLRPGVHQQHQASDQKYSNSGSAVGSWQSHPKERLRQTT